MANKINIVEKKFNFNNLNRRAATDRIIIHHTGDADIDASAEQIHQWHLNAGYSGIGYHFVIRKNGTVERARPVWSIGAHAYGANSDSVGVHLSGSFTYNLPTDKQIESTAILLADLCNCYNLPIDRKHILGHREVDPAGIRGTSCPGNMLQDYLDVIVKKAAWYNATPNENIALPADSKPPRAGMLSEHFAENEFACHCCGKLHIEPKLINLIEQLRYNIGGYPLYINSGYRCFKHNAEVGGVTNSQHCKGTAADISCPKQLNFGQFKWYVEQLPFDGLGFYPDDNFIHVDIRDGAANSKIRWEG